MSLLEPNITGILTSTTPIGVSGDNGPNMDFLNTINNVLPYVVAVVVGIVAMIVFVWYTRKYMPPIARDLTKAYHSRGLPAFIQDEMGNIGFYHARKKLPEGVIFIERLGWFLLPNPPPFDVKTMYDTPRSALTEKRKPGRPPKQKALTEEEAKQLFQEMQNKTQTATQPAAPLSPEEQERQKWAKASPTEKEHWIQTYGMLVQTPILKGFGKQVFFGSAVAAGLSNLNAIAHSHLPDVRALAPTMYQKTQLDALATGNRIEGLRMANKEVTKLLMYAIIAVVPIACFAIAAWLLTQKPA